MLIDENGRTWDIDTSFGYFLPSDQIPALWDAAKVYWQEQYGAAIKKVEAEAKRDLLASLNTDPKSKLSEYGVALFRSKEEIILFIELHD